ncbi:MAG: hypothetical protein HOH38_04585 [Nitrospinaceae bacterium]|jgi:hypothetical protein|nr:hypothetical protein [Nitrospinaceae bacterium]
MSNDFTRVLKVAKELLSSNNINISDTCIEFKRLCRELLIAEQKVLKIELQRWQGDYSTQVPTMPSLHSGSVGSMNAPEVFDVSAKWTKRVKKLRGTFC